MATLETSIGKCERYFHNTIQYNTSRSYIINVDLIEGLQELALRKAMMKWRKMFDTVQ